MRMQSDQIAAVAPARVRLVQRGVWLGVATIGYNALEGFIAILVGGLAGSIALVGFGVDSVIELVAGLAAIGRLRADSELSRREAAERRVIRVVGSSFIALAAYITYEALTALARHEAPEESTVGIALAALSLVVMPALAHAKRRVARGLGSGALEAEATQTDVCAWLSAILLAGLVMNALLGWWWADPVAALGMAPLILREGLEGLRGSDPCRDACDS